MIQSLRVKKVLRLRQVKQPSGWQGHNPERGWIMVFRYAIDIETEPPENRMPTRFVEILAAELMPEDWSFSGRKGNSRRTPTASILKTGVEKLRSNVIYREPA